MYDGNMNTESFQVMIDRIGLRVEKTGVVSRAIRIMYDDDLTIVEMDFRVEDAEVIKALDRARDRNATLDEIFLFAEMRDSPFVIDGVEKYTAKDVERLLMSPPPPAPPKRLMPAVRKRRLPVSSNLPELAPLPDEDVIGRRREEIDIISSSVSSEEVPCADSPSKAEAEAQVETDIDEVPEESRSSSIEVLREEPPAESMPATLHPDELLD